MPLGIPALALLLLLAAGDPVAAPGAPRRILRDGREVVLLAREHRGACVDVRTDCEVDLTGIGALAARILPRLRAWYGPGPAAPKVPPRYTIFLCSTVERMLEVERLCGEMNSRLPGRSFAYRGGFYERTGTIVLQPGTPRDTRWAIAHELAHAAFAERVGRAWADPLDEGLAEVLPDWLLFSELERPEEHVSTYPRYQSRCARAVGLGAEGSLSWLFSLDYWGFRDDRLDGLGYAASWALVKTLVESRDPEIAGRLQDLFTRIARGSALRAAVEEVYGLERLETLWRARMRSWTQWEPWWGAWKDAGHDWSTQLTSWDANLLVAHAEPGPAGFELGFTWDRPASEFVGVGFAFGVREGEHMALLDILESERRVRLEINRGDEWEHERSWPLPPELELACQAVELRLDPAAGVVLRIGDWLLPIAEYDPVGLDGRCGLIVQRLLYAPRREAVESTFLDPWAKPR